MSNLGYLRTCILVATKFSMTNNNEGVLLTESIISHIPPSRLNEDNFTGSIFNWRRAARGTRSSKLFGVRRFKVNGGQSNLASGPPPSDGDARDDMIWRVELPWGPSGV
jgi:hypothetical protein